MTVRKSVLLIPLLSLLSALAGCSSTANIKPDDLSALGPAPTAEEVAKVADGKPLYRLDYLAGGHAFLYETFEAADTERYYGLLFQDGKLAAVDLTDARAASWPELMPCTVFPVDPAQDVDACFQKFNQAALAAAVNVSGDVAPDQAAKDRKAITADKAVDAAVYITLTAPVWVPIAIIALPVMAVSESSHKAEGKPVSVTLGESYEDVRSQVQAYPAKFLSVTDGKGTVLVPGAGTSEVSSAFGVREDKIIWVSLFPRAGCGAGLFDEGTRCVMAGVTAPPGESVPRNPRPPVMDDWRNLAVYYTAPPKFEVLGETQSHAKGFTDKGRTEDALEEMKKQALQDGATAVLVYPDEYPRYQGLPASPPPADGLPIYGEAGEEPQSAQWIRGLEIYVPADAAAFQKAVPLHASECDGLYKREYAAKAAYEAAKDDDSKSKDEVAAAKQVYETANDAEDAAFCGDDDWYAEQMAAQEH